MQIQPFNRVFVVLAWLGLCAASLPAFGQLAITEVMSQASTNLGAARVTQHSDFWELTNFGTNTVALDEYRWIDNGGFDTANLFESGQMIAAGESIMLVKILAPGAVETTAQFREWWGDANLPANLKISFYINPGFTGSGDSVQLFHVTTNSTTLVDRVDYFQAQRGSTFTYDPVTGEFGVFSATGRGNAFKAAQTDDIGSPGYTTGPVPLTVTVPPQNLTVDAGTPATFSVQFHGLPKPRFQWRKSGVAIPGEISSTLTIFPALPANAGSYSVELDNGLTNVISAGATLVVNTNPECARIVVPPVDEEVYTNQTAIFSASVRGYPLAAIQWQSNGVNIANATNATFSILNATFSSAGDYTIRATNVLCTNTATAHLTVISVPMLLVTEAMSQASTNAAVSGHHDWWELTNVDTNAFNLRGYRFTDLPGPTLAHPFTNTDDVIIQPGESIIFVREMSAQAFKDWWGEENLPANIQIITYNAHNFDPAGDGPYFYNAAALDPLDYITGVYFDALNTNFPGEFRVVSGVSKWFDPEDPDCLQYGCESVLGQRGAIRAIEADDIGSPGWTTNHPPGGHAPRFTSLTRNASGSSLTWKTRAGKQYELQSKSTLTNASWTPVSQHSATGLSLTILDATATNAATRLYRLQVLP